MRRLLIGVLLLGAFACGGNPSAPTLSTTAGGSVSNSPFQPTPICTAPLPPLPGQFIKTDALTVTVDPSRPNRIQMAPGHVDGVMTAELVWPSAANRLTFTVSRQDNTNARIVDSVQTSATTSAACWHGGNEGDPGYVFLLTLTEGPAVTVRLSVTQPAIR